VVVTGEEFVLLACWRCCWLARRASRCGRRSAAARQRRAGRIPASITRGGRADGVAEELIDTGVQRLVGDLDELPDPVLGYRLLEAPSRGPTLGRAAVRGRPQLRPISSIVLTFGCKFACPYCPIPAYNQRQHRVKAAGASPRKLAC
jgi:hypothetical protein